MIMRGIFQKYFILFLVIFLSGIFYLPLELKAAATNPGDLIKISSSSAVYYFANNGSRYVFPNEKIYFSWYYNFSKVKTISDAAMADIPIGGNIFYRPGTRLIKIESDPKVYAVEPQGMLYWIESEAAAIALYGSNWASRVDDLSAAFFGDYYAIGELDGTSHPVGTLFKYPDSSTVYLLVLDNGQLIKRAMDSETFNALRYKEENVLEISTVYSYASGSALSSTDVAYSNTAQSAFARPSGVTFTRLDTGDRVLDRDSSRVNLMKIRILSEENIVINSLVFQIKALTNEDDDLDAGGLVRGNNQTNLEPNIKDFTIEKDGTEVLSEADISISGDYLQNFTLSGSYSVASRQSQELWVTGQVDPDCPLDEEFRLTLLISSSIIKDAAGKQVSNVNPSDELQSGVLEVQKGSVQVNAGNQVSTSTIVAGGELVDIASFKFVFAGNGALTINKIALTGYIDENEGSDDFVRGRDADDVDTTSFSDVVNKLYLYENNIRIAGPLYTDSGGYYVFDGLNYTVESIEDIQIKVKGDFVIEAPFEANFDRVAVDINDATNDVLVSSGGQTLTVSGTSPNGGTFPKVYITVRNNGILTFRNVDGVPEQEIVVAGASKYIAGYTIEAQYEDIKINRLAFKNPYNFSDDCIDYVKMNYSASGISGSKQAFVSGSVAEYSGLNLIIPKGSKANISLTLFTKTIAQGCDSGDQLAFNLDLSEGFEAWGISSLDVFDEARINNSEYVNNTTTANDYIVMRKTEPIISFNVANPSGDAIRGMTEMLRFDIKADSGGEVKIKKLVFKINASDIGEFGDDSDLLEWLADINGDFYDDNDVIDLYTTENPTEYIGEGIGQSIKYKIFDYSADTLDDTPAGLQTGGGDYGIIEIEFNRGFELVIPAGVTKTFVLELDTSGLDSGEQKVRMSLIGDDERFGSLIWNDGEEDTDSQWVETLPLSGRELLFY